MYACMCITICVCMCKWVSVYTCMYVYVHVYMYICDRVRGYFYNRASRNRIAKTAIFMRAIRNRDVRLQSAITRRAKAFHSFNVSD